MPKLSFDKLDEPFSEDEKNSPPKNKHEKPLPDFDLEEPFVEDVNQVSAPPNLNEAEWQATSEALARQAEIRKKIGLEALKIGSERERGQDREVLPKEEKSEALIEKDRQEALVKLATGIMTNESAEDMKAYMADYIQNLPHNKYILASMFRSIFERKLKDMVDTFVVDLMAEDKLPDLAVINEVESKIFEYLDQEAEKRRVKPARGAQEPFFKLTGSDE